MNAALYIWVVHVFGTVYMTGLIWVIQGVHYPLMNRIRSEDYVEFQAQHMLRITWVVGPAMLAEAVTALLLVRFAPDFLTWPAALLNLALLSVIWLSTAVYQVPSHRRLAQGFDAVAHRRLVQTNWIRTVAWTIRSGLLLYWWIA